MHAATTKIPYLLCEKTNLKTLNGTHDFIDNIWFIYKECCMMGIGEKPRNTKNETKEKIPRLVALHSLLLQNGSQLFSGVRKQAGPLKVSVCFVVTVLNSSKQAVVDQFIYSQKR